jgi:cyclase
VSDAVSVPVIASGGVGTLAHFAAGVTDGRADALLAASVFHDGIFSVRAVKEYLRDLGIPVRIPAELRSLGPSSASHE